MVVVVCGNGVGVVVVEVATVVVSMVVLLVAVVDCVVEGSET